ncbi:MAG TPA: class I SAM-dependent methyltransferase [Thermomicrobiales bacterium]|nr:class I SAM-dependent methyltransferase [Thermomicrobiales bacterium]
MSISETYKYESNIQVDTSNFRKHTSDSPVQRKLIDRFHQRITGIVTSYKPESLLDAGCGEGFVADILQTAMPTANFTGFDVLEDSVALAQLRNPRGAFAVGDIYNIAYPDRSFDVVYCFEVLEHLHEPDKALKELARVARTAVILSVPHEPFFCLANAARGRNLDQDPKGSDPDHRNFWSRRQFAEFASVALEVQLVTGSVPWTILAGSPKPGERPD